MFRLYDTLARQVVPVAAGRRGELRMYTCGPTVYRAAHVGNLRSYLLSDLIRRNAERHQLTVVVCQNITDVGHLTDDSAIDPRLRRAVRQPPHRLAAGTPLRRRGEREETVPCGLGALEGRGRGPGADLVNALGDRLPRLAYRVLRHVVALPRQPDRHPY